MTVVNCDLQPAENSKETTNVDGALDMSDFLQDLEGPFRKVVIKSLNEILNKRPTDPIRLLADRLLEESKSHKVERIECVVDDGTMCTLTRACTRKTGAQLHRVPGLPLLQLVAPTVFELDAAIRHLDTLSHPKSRVILFLEPPIPSTDLFFFKGVPYFSNITGQLLQQRRSRAADDKLTDSKGEASLENVISMLQAALGTKINTLREEVALVVPPESRFVVVELPDTQRNFFELFDAIDMVFGRKKHFWDDNLASLHELAPTLLVSFNPKGANMTLSRIIAAMLPIYEHLQRSKIALILETNRARIRQLNYAYVSGYWAEVLQRRDARDQARRQAKLGQARIRLRSQKLSVAKEAIVVAKKEPNLSCVVRARRRETEDNSFLQVLQQLRVYAVTRIQALYRGYRSRKKIKFLPSRGKDSVDVACWIEELPSSLPVLLRRCVERLSMVHGELFGNYVASCPPFPRSVTVLKPSRTVIKAVDVKTTTHSVGGTADRRDVANNDDDIDSEAEIWERETVILPLKRQTKPLPHFNVLRRLVECEQLGNCDTIGQAMFFQNECNGLSVLQRRAYNSYKSLVLNLLHIAFLELYHRGKLPVAIVTFEEYMHFFHRDVFAWLSAPHLFSRIFSQSMIKSKYILPVLSFKEVVETERVLLLCPCKDPSFCVSPKQQPKEEQKIPEEKLQKEQGGPLDFMGQSLTVASVANTLLCSPFLCSFEGLYAISAFISEVMWETSLREISFESFDGKKVAWWSLHPDPMVYVDSEPVVLTTRHELQEVEGRARFDEYVLRIEETKNTGTTSLRAVKNSLKETLDALRGNVGCSGLTNGLEQEMGGNVVASENTAEAGDNILMCDTSFSTFGLSLRAEDLHLARLVNRSRAISSNDSNPGLQMYFLTNMQTLCGVPVVTVGHQPVFLLQDLKSQPTHYSTAFDNFCTPNVSFLEERPFLCSEGPSFQNCDLSRSVESTRPGSIPVEGLSSLNVAFQGSLSRKMSIASMECGINARFIISQTHSFSSAAAESVDAVAQKVAGRVFKKGDFVHFRPWLTPVCGRTWVNIFEKFVSKCLYQLRHGYSIVLTISDPSHVMLFNAVCLLKCVVQRQKEKDENEESLAVFRLGPRKSALAPLPPILSMEATSCLLFMDGFYKCVEKLVKQSNISVFNSIYQVQKVMQARSPGGLVFLEELPALISGAERATDPRKLVDVILLIVQRVELYCWLILFEVFLSFSVAVGNVDEAGNPVLSSFSAFVDDVDLTRWIDYIDPWQHVPWKSPDPFHLRYSNGLRRWDERNYILRVAF